MRSLVSQGGRMLKKLDWGMVLPLVLFVLVIAGALALTGPSFIEKKLYVGAFIRVPIDWPSFGIAAALVYLMIVAGFCLVEIGKEVRVAQRRVRVSC